MKATVIDYRSACNRKAMAEDAAKEFREAYANVRIKEIEQSKKSDLKVTVGNKPFVLIATNDFWSDGQWLRYLEERTKAYGVEEQPDGAIQR